MGRFFALLAVLVIILSVPSVYVYAVEKNTDVRSVMMGDVMSGIFGRYPLDTAEDYVITDKGELNKPKNWEFDIGLQRYIVSHTSYEIGNSNPPFQKPLSRLEFPLNTWWLDFRLRRTCPRWSAGLKAGFSVARNVDGRMKDSDWENDNSPDMLTTYSESAMRAESNYHFRTDVDINISDWLGLPSSVEIRPLFAFQFQRLSLMAHDGVQWTNGLYQSDEEMDLDGSIQSTELAGDSIHFRQDYYLYQIGCKGSYRMRLTRNIEMKLSGEADWGPAVAFNEDHHLKREGDLFGYIKSSGNSMYFTTGVDMVVAKTFTIGIIMDYLWIRTAGETRHYNAPRGENIKWTDGVKAWSDQTSLIARASYAF